MVISIVWEDDMRRIWLFLKSLWEGQIIKVYSVIGGGIGVLQLLQPIFPNEIDFLNFFTTRWDWKIWVIIVLVGIVLALIQRAYLLGGFQMEMILGIVSNKTLDEIARYLSLKITNGSPNILRNLNVRIVDVRLVGNPHWRPSSAIDRKDNFPLSGGRGVSAEVDPGHNAGFDLVKFSENTVRVELSKGEMLLNGYGEYIIDCEIISVYEGKRYEFPISFGFDWGGQMDIADVSFVGIDDYDWRISKQLTIEVN